MSEIRERVKPIPKPRKSLLKRSATVNIKNSADLETQSLVRSNSSDQLISTCEEESLCSCPPIMERGVIEQTECADQMSSKQSFNTPCPSIEEEPESLYETRMEDPSLWDKITRTHQIWYLETFRDRFAASHILRQMNPGTFIVRSSSKPESMALSVRMPFEWSVEVEHYLIEKLVSGVKLEGSPNVFLSLAFLIQNYCMNGDEIHVKLQLPEAIQKAKSVVELDKMALLGQDFWSSEMARPPSVYMSKSSNEPASLKMSQSMYGLASQDDFQAEPRRPTMRLGTTALSHDYYSPPSYESWSKQKRPIQMGVASGLLKKSYSAYGIAQKEREDNGYNHSNSRSLKVRSKRSSNFLRNLFATNEKAFTKHEHPPPRTLTQCEDDYFLPKTLSESSSFLKSDQRSGECGWSPDCKACNLSTTPDVKPKRPVERFLSASTSMGRRLKAKAFRGDKQQCSKDDMLFGSPVDDSQHQLRRQNTDLCASRLANFTLSSTRQQPNNMPEHRRFHTGPIVPPHAGRMSNHSMQNCIEELRLKRAGNGSTSSKASSSRTDDSEDRPNVILRVQEKSNQVPINERDMSSRMSVPNLSATEMKSQNDDSRVPVAKLNKTSTGELQGLITPVVRRKYTNGQHRQVVRIPPDSFSTKNNLSRTDNDEQSARLTQKQIAQSLAAELNHLASKNRTDSEIKPSSTFGQKNLLRTRSAIPSKVAEEIPSFVHKIQPWAAVNRELKNRQLQIAKVKPQPVVRTRQPAIIGSKSKMENSDDGVCEAILSTSLEDRKNDQDDDDVVSTAGTVFNEPWDSNALENLLDIAQFCDEKPSKAKAKAAYMECCTQETIAEEEDNCSYCGSVSTTSISPYSHTSRNAPSPTRNSNSDVEVHQVSLSPEDKVEEMTFGLQERPRSSELILDMKTNKMWNEMSKQIPSDAGSTVDSRKDNRSRSMLNVASDLPGTPILERQRHLRAQTPGVFNTNTSRLNDSLDSFNTILPATSPARLRNTDRNNDPSQRIQNYIEKLAIDSTSTFGASLQCFIECTIDSENSDPRLVIRNARQFITGIKNYLTNGEAIQEIIEQESSKLQPNEFLNIDAILEGVLHKIVLATIKPKVYQLFCHASIKNGSFETLTSNLSLVRTFSMDRLGFPPTIKAPDMKTIELIRKYLRKMQNHYSPLKKFENLLNALSLVVKPANSTLLRVDSTKKLPCPDIIRWLVYLLAKTCCVTCEIEAYYMWELLTPQLLTTGHVIYYLSTLFSAIHILKNSDSIDRLRFMTENPTFTSPQASLQACIDEAADGFFRCCIPNEHSGTIEYRIFPMVAQLNVQRLCQIIANQLSISNNDDYGLFVLYDACETLLHNNESPLTVRLDLNSSGKAHFFAYKRIEAKIAWPSSAVQLATSTSFNQPLQATFGSTQSRFV